MLISWKMTHQLQFFPNKRNHKCDNITKYNSAKIQKVVKYTKNWGWVHRNPPFVTLSVKFLKIMFLAKVTWTGSKFVKAEFYHKCSWVRPLCTFFSTNSLSLTDTNRTLIINLVNSYESCRSCSYARICNYISFTGILGKLILQYCI